ncbi:hypothetical protein ACR9HG_23780, partial [Enterobacter ludwigii]
GTSGGAAGAAGAPGPVDGEGGAETGLRGDGALGVCAVQQGLSPDSWGRKVATDYIHYYLLMKK